MPDETAFLWMPHLEANATIRRVSWKVESIDQSENYGCGPPPGSTIPFCGSEIMFLKPRRISRCRMSLAMVPAKRGGTLPKCVVSRADEVLSIEQFAAKLTWAYLTLETAKLAVWIIAAYLRGA